MYEYVNLTYKCSCTNPWAETYYAPYQRYMQGRTLRWHWNVFFTPEKNEVSAPFAGMFANSWATGYVRNASAIAIPPKRQCESDCIQTKPASATHVNEQQKQTKTAKANWFLHCGCCNVGEPITKLMGMIHRVAFVLCLNIYPVHPCDSVKLWSSFTCCGCFLNASPKVNASAERNIYPMPFTTHTTLLTSVPIDHGLQAYRTIWKTRVYNSADGQVLGANSSNILEMIPRNVPGHLVKTKRYDSATSTKPIMFSGKPKQNPAGI